MRKRSTTHPTRRALTAVLSALVLVVACVVTATAGPAHAAPVLLSQGKSATASSTENAGTPASAAVDGNTGTRWSSAFGDPQWLQVDLGGAATLSQVTLNWEAAYATSFKIQLSADATTWTDLYSTTTGTGGTQTLDVTGSGRYVRLYGTTRATAYGYSLWEFQVYGTTTGTACGTADAAQGRPATASSAENTATPASAAVDGNSATRWSSAAADPQWLQVDLGSVKTICKVVLAWEAAYATAFRIQVSDNASTWTDLYSTTTGTGGTQTLNVTGDGRYVRMYGTTRATAYGYSLWSFTVNTTGGSTDPTTPPPDAFWGDTSNIPAARNVVMVKILNRTNGQYPDSQVYWSYNGQVHSIAEQPYFDMPANTAGRMYFYLGSPNSQYYDFIEFTVGPSVFNGNTTRVDAFGLKLAMRLHARDGYDVAVGEDSATFAESRAATFQRFIDEVPAEFKQLAQVQAPYRIPAPGSASIFQPGGAYANYFTGYAAQQGVTATTSQVTGCAGPLAEAPKMCAALNRHVAGLSDAQQSDAANYYKAAPANYYAKFWHDHAIGKLAYGFPYDDYAGQSSFVSHGDPQWLLVAVGW
ncbi:coagulation factor 5/8 type domain-containing protein [Microbispora cellulosiformans]|uniref:Coagulation factor 5/8 type domain-containing protein n=2 Tax=Microbispora TaxID=2005 RepID=A0A5J5KBZ5_9ACTN|nr:discoidin domain-containing protein [Microbispora cellulosiformans]KAA9381318.1 coagulation factor 5/8 type domain-containing protein [Microbispora cellulosiformans]